jgi:hypothetical protein
MIDRPKITPEQVRDAMTFLTRHLQCRLGQKGYGSFASSHEAESVVRIECDEMSEVVRKHGKMPDLKWEMLDIAVAAVFAVACVEAKTPDW